MMHLNQALKDMHRVDHDGRAVPFTVGFCTADKRRKTGGELIEIESAILTFSDKKDAAKVMNEMEADSQSSKKRKRANHRINRTRNFLLPNGQIRKAHISLITSFNGQVVI